MSKDTLRPGQKIKMVSYDELCGGGAPTKDVTAGETMIGVDVIDDFENHPFKVLDDEKMDELVESIEENGILSPVIVRSKFNGRYELISGHRRRHAAVRAGLTEIPAIVKELSDDEAIVLMVDANIQREEILPSERAKSLKMKMDALARQKADGKLLGNKRREILAEDAGISGRQIQRYINLNMLIPELLELVDQKKLQLKMADKIASLSTDIQEYINEYISLGGSISMDAIDRIKAAAEDSVVTGEVVDYILNENKYKDKAKKVVINEKKLNMYFPNYYSIDDIEGVIYQLLDQWKWSREGAEENE